MPLPLSPKITELLTSLIEHLKESNKAQILPMIWVDSLELVGRALLTQDEEDLLAKLVAATKFWCAARERDLGLVWYQTSGDLVKGRQSFQDPRSDLWMKNYLSMLMDRDSIKVARSINEITIDGGGPHPFMECWNRYPPLDEVKSEDKNDD